jgi:ABC-2 type transport system ATP-binding protein
MAMTADRLVIIGRGRLITETSIDDFLGSAPGNYVRVRTTRAEALVQVLQSAGAEVRPQPDGSLHVEGISTDQIGELAGRNGITLLELSVQQTTLEQRYMELTSESVDYRTANADLMPSADSR